MTTQIEKPQNPYDPTILTEDLPVAPMPPHEVELLLRGAWNDGLNTSIKWLNEQITNIWSDARPDNGNCTDTMFRLNLLVFLAALKQEDE